MKRRNFLKVSGLASAGLAVSAEARPLEKSRLISGATCVLSTWRHGMDANKAAWTILDRAGSALDAVESGVRVTESDPESQSVGLGGLPDREGKVTLDACIMDHESNCGSVAFLQNIENPISVARRVMENTPHVFLAGEGAYRFAREEGFPHTELLTEKSRQAWEKWKADEQSKKPSINQENHDTIGMLALDAKGNLSGACTTSGWAYKLHGRVGDSPIIGAGLFVDNEVGAACATGMGEAVIRIAGSATVVELMRHGYSPQQACKEAVERIKAKHKDLDGLQVGFLALNKSGEVGAHSVYAGFDYAYRDAQSEEMRKASFDLNW